MNHSFSDVGEKQSACVLTRLGNGKMIQIFGGKYERRGVACVCSALICFAGQKLLFKARVRHFGKYDYSLSGRA